MYEMMTYDKILSDMLKKVPSDVDKREGSIIYDAVAPCAYFLAQEYFYLEQYLDLLFGDTAIGAYLDRIVSDHGMKRKPATKAVRRVKSSGSLPGGSRWAISGTSYQITKKLSETEYLAECEQYGEIGNRYAGGLSSLGNLHGVRVELTDIVTTGLEEESDENLRTRFYGKVRMPATSGNAYQYRQWALEVPACGDAKVFPLYDGPGTVMILVVNNELKGENALPEAVSAHIEEVRPIGAEVMVYCPKEVRIEIQASILTDGTKTPEEIQETFTKVLDSYLKGTVFKKYKISYALIGSMLLDIDGVTDYDYLSLNDQMSNITLDPEVIPVLGSVTITSGKM